MAEDGIGLPMSLTMTLTSAINIPFQQPKLRLPGLLLLFHSSFILCTMGVEVAALDLSPRALAFGDSFCICDLNPEQCDVNCCCDLQCSDEDIALSFAEPCDTSQSQKGVLFESCSLAEERKRLGEQSSMWDVLFSVLCVLKTNRITGPTILTEPVGDGISSLRSSIPWIYEERHHEQLSPQSTQSYQYGDTVFVSRALPIHTETLSPLFLETSIVGGGCGLLQVQFQKPTTAECSWGIRSSADLRELCSTQLNATYIVEQLGRIIKSPESLEVVPLSVNEFTRTEFEGNHCIGAAASIKLKLIWSEEGITNAVLHIRSVNITHMPSGFLQTKSVVFTTLLEAIERSGRPGYEIGKPLIFQDLPFLFEFALSSLRKIRMFIFELTLLQVITRPITFGDNYISTCVASFSFSGLDSCSALQKQFSKYLYIHRLARRVGIYGDSDISRNSDFVELQLFVRPEPQMDFRFVPSSACRNVPTSTNIQFLTTVQRDHNGTLHHIIFAGRIIVNTKTISPQDKLGQQLELISVSTQFIEITESASRKPVHKISGGQSCFHGTCWKRSLNIAQQNRHDSPHSQAEYARLLAEFIPVTVAIIGAILSRIVLGA
eukprot:gene936-4190_t